MGLANKNGKQPEPDADSCASSTEEEEEEESCWSRTLQGAFPTGFKAETRVVMKILPPLVIATMAQWYVQPIASIFAGHLGKIELDAVGLSCSLINVLGYSIAFGMTAACDASFAQTFGGNNKKMMGIYLQKCLFIISLSALPCYALHLNIEGILQLFGQDPVVARLCGRYLFIHTPGTFAMFFYLILQKYFQCQSIVYPDIWMGLLSHAIHATLQYVLLYELNMGVEGSAIALASYYVSSLLFRILYFFYSKNVKVTWGGWSLQCFGGWGPLTKLAVYGCILMCAEWWAYEACTILAGLFGTAVLGAQTIIFNMTVITAAVASGISMASTISMGQYLGAGMPMEAKTSGRVTFVMIFVIGTFLMTIWLVFPDDIARLFTGERDVLDIISISMPILSVYMFMNAFTTLARCLFRAVAKQKEAAVIVFFCYYLVAMPLGYSLMFLTPWKLSGMWLGFLVCTVLMAIIMTVRYMWFFDWESMAEEAQIRACVMVCNEKPPTHADLRTALLSGSTRQGSYGGIADRKLDQPSFEKSFYAITGSTDVPPGVINMQEETVTRRDVVNKILIISLFICIAMIGLVVRIATADMVEQFRLADDSSAEGLTNVTSRSSQDMTSWPIDVIGL